MPFTKGGLTGPEIKQTKPPKPLPALWDRRRYIHFYGEGFANPTFNFSFDVLSGDQPPTIVDGYAEWADVPRPLRVGLLVYTGRKPISMQVSVRFMQFDTTGSWMTDDAAGLVVEKRIAVMEWMAGEGVSVGPSPKVWLTTYDAGAQTIPLIPFQYQAATSHVPEIFGGGDTAPWVVTGLTWDPAPLRTANAYRIRQDATVTLTYYSSFPGQQTTDLPRPKAITVTSHAGVDTPLKIARHVSSNNPPKLAKGIVDDTQNKALHLRYVNQPIKHGKKVRVPASASS